MRARFTVLGAPCGKGRHRTTQTGRTYTPKETVVYENLIKTEFRRQCGELQFQTGEALDMRVMAYYPIPVSISKKKRNLMLERKLRPTKKPDWDNIGKVVGDSLNLIAYHDDAQIVDSQVRKFYSDQPRIEVIIQTASVE